MRTLLFCTALALPISTHSAPWCKYSDAHGALHATQSSTSVAVVCSDGSQVSLIDPPAQPETDPHTSLYAQGLDLGTTAAAIGMGFTEANPILAPLTGSPAGFAAIAALKFSAVNHFRSMPQPECEKWLGASTSLIGGVGLANAALIAGATQGASLVVGAIAIPVIDYLTDDSTRRECRAGPMRFDPPQPQIADSR